MEPPEKPGRFNRSPRAKPEEYREQVLDPARAEPESSSAWIVSDVTVIPVDTDEVWPHRDVLIRSGRIEAIVDQDAGPREGGIRGANARNLQDVDIDIPLGVLCFVTGVSTTCEECEGKRIPAEHLAAYVGTA